MPTRDEEVAYPAFQFASDGTLHPAIARIIDILGVVVATPYTIASWLQSPRAQLDGETPIRWLQLGRDPERAIAEARITAAHLAD